MATVEQAVPPLEQGDKLTRDELRELALKSWSAFV